MNSGKEFEIEYVTCDINRQRGGERVHIKRAVISSRKNRRHYREYNNVRNIKQVGTKDIRAVHPLLIIKINGRTITL